MEQTIFPNTMTVITVKRRHARTKTAPPLFLLFITLPLVGSNREHMGMTDRKGGTCSQRTSSVGYICHTEEFFSTG